MVGEFREHVDELYETHVKTFAREAWEHLDSLNEITSQKAKAPQVRSVLKSFDAKFRARKEQACASLDTWCDVLGGGDVNVLAFGQRILSPRSFCNKFLPLAEKRRDALAENQRAKTAAS